jgi:GH24 family phage-related lysozyme (muramidase)
MYDSVRNNFISFNVPFEAKVEYMYLDIIGKVTIGIGNLIDPVDTALGLPFVHKTDESQPATVDEIRAEWNAVHDDSSLATRGARAAAAVTALKLTDSDITALVLSKLSSFARALQATPEFSGLDTWPADAQLGILSMAWALGAGFGPTWPVFRAACATSDWAAAAAACKISEAGNPGVAPRNAANLRLFQNAAAVAAAGSDATVLWYPSSPTAAATTTPGPVSTDSDGGTPDASEPSDTSTPDTDEPSDAGIPGGTDPGMGAEIDQSDRGAPVSSDAGI